MMPKLDANHRLLVCVDLDKAMLERKAYNAGVLTCLDAISVTVSSLMSCDGAMFIGTKSFQPDGTSGIFQLFQERPGGIEQIAAEITNVSCAFRLPQTYFYIVLQFCTFFENFFPFEV